MEFSEAKSRFIQAWGTLATSWGINRTMAQIHALLLVSPIALSADDIMDELKISRGNSNMNLRTLIDWGLVHKELRAGERREFFFAEKDMVDVVRRIIAQRKKKELEPMLKVLEELSGVTGSSPEAREFSKVITDIQLFSQKANLTLDTIMKADANLLIGTLFKMVK
jgi:DNA-binding transcriptional regulator GbsR (MarR family)